MDYSQGPESWWSVLIGQFITRESRRLMVTDAFTAPFMHSHFNRVWTVQEIVMARSIRIHHGHATVPWPDFVTTALFAVKEPGGFLKFQEKAADIHTDEITQWSLINALETHFVLPDHLGLEALYQRRDASVLQTVTKGTANLALSKSHALNATEPKDKAYAMLWAFAEDSEANTALRQVDYAKPIELIYLEFAIAIMVKMEAPTDIFYNINTEGRNPNLPSWVPDWQISAPMSYYLWSRSLREHRAAGQASLRYHISVNGARLQLRGKQVDTIKALIALSQEARQRSADFNDTALLIESLMDMAALMKGLTDTYRTLVPVATDEELGDILSSLIWNQKEEFKIAPTEAQICAQEDVTPTRLRVTIFHSLSFLIDMDTLHSEEVFSALRPFLPDHSIETILHQASELPRLPPFLALAVALDEYIGLYHFLIVVANNHGDKDFFITANGSPSLAFHGMKGGDHIMLWEGCRSPMVVQRVEMEGEVVWRIRGPAHVIGLMDGDAWDEDVELQSFNVI
jgi:hypothetical protein